MLDKMKKKKSAMDELHKSAKMDAIHGLRDVAMDAMKGKLDGLKKVTVASDSKEGLKAGLDKAKDIMNKGPLADEAAAEGESEAEESAEHAAGDIDDASMHEGGQSKEELMAELEQKLKEMEELKAKLMKA